MKTLPTILAHAPSWTRIPPTQKGDSLILSGADGKFRAYDTQNGTEKWSTPAVEESERFQITDRYLVSTGLDSVVGFSSVDGRALWQRSEPMRLEALTNVALLASQRGEIQSLDPQTGNTVWQVDVHQPVVLWNGSALTVEGERDRRETLQARDLQSGTPKWQTSDGDIRHVVPFGDQLLYSAVKFGRHHQEVQRVSSRGVDGSLKWSFRCPGELRVPPQPSPDGGRIALLQKAPADPSRSVLSILDNEGKLVFETAAAHKVDIAFRDDGGLVLSETEFSRTPGEEETRLRGLDSEGNERWSRPGRADWMRSGSDLIVSQDKTLTAIDPATGRNRWSRPLSGNLAPLNMSQGLIQVSLDGCSILTLETKSGDVVSTTSTGHSFFVNPQGRVADHEGQIWEESLPLDRSLFVGEWKEVEPFHIGMKSAPTSRNERPAVYVDWDGDERDDGSDPVLLDQNRELVSWQQLEARDADRDSRLNNEELSQLNLWFDSDGDGQVSSDAEFRPLLDSSFDKGRVELDHQLLWLASDSRCD